MEIKRTSTTVEKRRYPRLKDNVFILGCSRLNPVEGFKAITKDISGRGLMFEIEKKISRESELEVEIYQPLHTDKVNILSVSVLAKVIWTKKIDKDDFEEGENKYRVGIEFLRIKEEDRERIVKYIEENVSGE